MWSAGLKRDFADVVDRANAGMIQRGCGARFALKSLEGRRVAGKLRRKEFQRDVPAEARVFGSKHLAHAAAAKRFENFVVGDGFADHAWPR